MKSVTIIFLLTSFSAFAQKHDPAIINPINNMFKAMELGDSNMLHKSFFANATLITVLEKEGKFKLRKEELISFLKAVGSPHDVTWHEPIWDVEVQQDGNFAQVWAKYAFYAGDKFSHCGVDTFQLIKTEDGWKIFYLADTRNKTGCSIPEKISKQYTTKK